MTTTLPTQGYDVEARAGALGVEPFAPIEQELQALADMLAETDAEYAELWALFGPGDGWDAQRKALWCVKATEIRDAAATAGEKTTEASIEQRAHAHPAYRRFLDEAIIRRARFAELTSQRGAIQARREVLIMRANRGQMLGRFLAAEARL